MLNSYKIYKLFSLSQKLGIKPVFFIFYFFVIVSSSKAQENLVPNGDFEEYDSCPSGGADFSVSLWYSPTGATPDYFHPCAGLSGAGVPSNFAGHQNAHNGFGYCGFTSGFELPNENAREYIQTELVDELQANQDYLFSCYINLAEMSKFCSKDIGISLTSNPIGGNFGTPIYSEDVYYPSIDFICDTANWVYLSCFITAQGGEKFLTIGIFEDDNNTDILLFNNANEVHAYYYIDNVILTEYRLPDFPNVFTPNDDYVNDFWIIELPNGYEVSIINRWGVLVNNSIVTNQSYFWDGKSNNGTNCSEGLYIYQVRKNNLIVKTGFIHLLK